MEPARAWTAQARRAGQRSRRRAAPLIAYFDTSALIKLLLEEDGSELADELWSRASSRIASHLVYPEARAALAAAWRSGRIDAPTHAVTVRELHAACAAMRLVGVDRQLALGAGDAAERYGLRGYDAVHLVTALGVDATDLVLVTWDRDLAAAALAAGRPVAPALD